MDFILGCQLLAKGARWGDVEEMDLEDILIDLQKRYVEIKQAKAKRLVKQFQPVQVQPKPAVPYVRPHFKRDFSKSYKTCIGCKKFTRHSNPPSHFTEIDKSHCCAYCHVTNGKKHGGSCEKNRA